MKLKVLGSGSHGNCYILEGETSSLLLECGLRWKDILKGLNYRIDNVAGCLISHEHGDHSKATENVINSSIKIGTSKGTLKAILKQDVCGISIYNFDILESGLQDYMDNFTILPFTVEHDAAEPLGFLIQHPECGKLIYLTDTYYCRYKFTGLNHIMIEANYSMDILKENIENGSIPAPLAERIMKSHFSLEHVKEFLQANDLSQIKDIVLLHLSDGNSNAKHFQSEIEGLTGKPVYIAQKGLEIEL